MLTTVVLFATCIIATAQKRTHKSTIEDQESIAITIYNSNLGLVKDVRDVRLSKGVIDLRFEGDRLAGWDRHLMDAPGEGFIYHKHPAEVKGRGLLFFHGRLEPDGKLKLMVRSTEPGSEVYVVKPYWKGKPLKAAKHPCSSFEVANLVFIAKCKGEKAYRLMLSLTEEALANVQRVVRPAQAGAAAG